MLISGDFNGTNRELKIHVKRISVGEGRRGLPENGGWGRGVR